MQATKVSACCPPQSTWTSLGRQLQIRQHPHLLPFSIYPGAIVLFHSNLLLRIRRILCSLYQQGQVSQKFLSARPQLYCTQRIWNMQPWLLIWRVCRCMLCLSKRVFRCMRIILTEVKNNDSRRQQNIPSSWNTALIASFSSDRSNCEAMNVLMTSFCFDKVAFFRLSSAFMVFSAASWLSSFSTSSVTSNFGLPLILLCRAVASHACWRAFSALGLSFGSTVSSSLIKSLASSDTVSQVAGGNV